MKKQNLKAETKQNELKSKLKANIKQKSHKIARKIKHDKEKVIKMQHYVYDLIR